MLSKEEAKRLFAKVLGVLTPENEDEDHECAVCFDSLANDKDDLLRILRSLRPHLL